MPIHDLHGRQTRSLFKIYTDGRSDPSPRSTRARQIRSLSTIYTDDRSDLYSKSTRTTSQISLHNLNERNIRFPFTVSSVYVYVTIHSLALIATLHNDSCWGRRCAAKFSWGGQCCDREDTLYFAAGVEPLARVARR